MSAFFLTWFAASMLVLLGYVLGVSTERGR
jgi:hypothetical protein